MEKFPPYEEKETEWKLISDNKNGIDYSKAEKKPQIIAAIAGTPELCTKLLLSKKTCFNFFTQLLWEFTYWEQLSVGLLPSHLNC